MEKGFFLTQYEIKGVTSGETRSVYRVAGLRRVNFSKGEKEGDVNWEVSFSGWGRHRKVTGQSSNTTRRAILDGFGVYCGLCEPGDRLWVRESFALEGNLVRYKASSREDKAKWKSPLYMSRRMSRMSLHVKSVRLGRMLEFGDPNVAKEDFKDAWDDKNKLNRYDSNPWVWQIEFDVSYP